MNSCTFTGRITKDAELKTSQAGKSFCYFCPNCGADMKCCAV